MAGVPVEDPRQPLLVEHLRLQLGVRELLGPRRDAHGTFTAPASIGGAEEDGTAR